MSPGRRGSPLAFTLIELLVAVSIIGVVVLLSVAGVMASRESSRKLQCANNLRQLGVALNSYHSAVGVLPPAYATRRVGGASEGGANWGWCAMVLPYLENAPLYNSINFSQTIIKPASMTTRHVSLGFLLCPSSGTPGPITITSRFSHLPILSDLVASNYIASAGTRSLGTSPISRDHSVFTLNSVGDGAMYRNSSIAFSGITDGSSHTLLAGERSSNLSDVTWLGSLPITIGAVCPKPGYYTQLCVSTNILVLGHANPENDRGNPIYVDQPNYEKYSLDCYWSYHSYGCQFLFCDGSVRFVQNSVNPHVFGSLATRSAGDPAGDY
jgi:prepilin-type N-terminal cleavage/methylation domain-containing protein/prepilin-type processing-associated H-X9-DG protein